MKTIGVCGFCSTGSSAVSDYLAEFNENQVVDNMEFTIAYLPDGLEDLEYHLTKQHSRDDDCYVAIERFRRLVRWLSDTSFPRKTNLKNRADIFLSSITQMVWKGGRRSDFIFSPSYLFYRYVGNSIMAIRVVPLIFKILGRAVNIYPYNRKIEVSVNPENFSIESKKFVRDILENLKCDFQKNIVLDQPFIGDDPAKSFHFFENPYAIVVDRDPRDNYLFAKKILSKKGFYMPIETVQDFCKYYRLMRDNRPYKQPNEKILRLNFEELVYDYENATAKIRRFCELGENPHPKSIFRPEMSMANTQLFLRYPEFKNDVAYIEKELSEYLFDFSKYPTPNLEGKMFMGKSPLNKKN